MKYYPVHQREQKYRTGKNIPCLKAAEEVAILHIIYPYVKKYEDLNRIKLF
jgi:hypothetical protein